MQADKIISDSNLDKEYSAIHGDAEFCKLVAQLAFGENSSIVKDGLVSTVCKIGLVRSMMPREVSEILWILLFVRIILCFLLVDSEMC